MAGNRAAVKPTAPARDAGRLYGPRGYAILRRNGMFTNARPGFRSGAHAQRFYEFMKYLALLVLGTSAAVTALPSQAGVISRACMQANRSAATPALCGCIQNVANVSLNRSERKKAAKLFNDPNKAQKIRQSDRRRDEEFWGRYKAFIEKAGKECK
jgi:hypothetical protein